MENQPLSLENLIEGFRLTCQTEGKSPCTTEWYVAFITRFRRYLADRHNLHNLVHLTKHHVRDFIRYLQVEAKTPVTNHPLSGATIRGYGRSIQAFLAWAVREEYITSSQVGRITLPKEPSKIVNTFSPAQVKSLLDTCRGTGSRGQRDQTMLLLMLDTGLRLTEVINITVEDLHLAEGTIKVRIAKGNKERMVPVGSLLQKYLWKYLTAYRPKPLTDQTHNLFLTTDGLPLKKSGVQQMLRRRGRAAGIAGVRCSPHTVRHTFAKNYVLNGGDIFSLQKILGHSSLSTVKIYLNLFAVDVKAQHQRFSPVDNMAPVLGNCRF
jgi:integrase/recombinase XerD